MVKDLAEGSEIYAKPKDNIGTSPRFSAISVSTLAYLIIKNNNGAYFANLANNPNSDLLLKEECYSNMVKNSHKFR